MQLALEVLSSTPGACLGIRSGRAADSFRAWQQSRRRHCRKGKPIPVLGSLRLEPNGSPPPRPRRSVPAAGDNRAVLQRSLLTVDRSQRNARPVGGRGLLDRAQALIEDPACRARRAGAALGGRDRASDRGRAGPAALDAGGNPITAYAHPLAAPRRAAVRARTSPLTFVQRQPRPRHRGPYTLARSRRRRTARPRQPHGDIPTDDRARRVRSMPRRRTGHIIHRPCTLPLSEQLGPRLALRGRSARRSAPSRSPRCWSRKSQPNAGPVDSFRRRRRVAVPA